MNEQGDYTGQEGFGRSVEYTTTCKLCLKKKTSNMCHHIREANSDFDDNVQLDVFCIKVTKSYTSQLSRQIGEEITILNITRGGR